MSLPGFATFLIVLLVIILISSVAWITFIHLRARRLGLPPPTLASYNPFTSFRSPYTPQPRTGGLVGWINDKIREFRYRRNRTAGGAYEGSLGSYGDAGAGGARGARTQRGFGPLDPDEAWDARVGTEADYGPGGYYEEQEVGLHADTRYTPAGGDEERGRARGRREEIGSFVGGDQAGLDARYGEETGGGSGSRKPPSQNPFDDDAATNSLRGLSPRPVVEASNPTKGKGHAKQDSTDKDPESPTERRSMFREAV